MTLCCCCPGEQQLFCIRPTIVSHSYTHVENATSVRMYKYFAKCLFVFFCRVVLCVATKKNLQKKTNNIMLKISYIILEWKPHTHSLFPFFWHIHNFSINHIYRDFGLCFVKYFWVRVKIREKKKRRILRELKREEEAKSQRIFRIFSFNQKKKEKKAGSIGFPYVGFYPSWDKFSNNCVQK